MEWLGLPFITGLPDSGQVILSCTHNPFLVLLAYVVACVGSFAMLDMAERVDHAQKAQSQRLWRLTGTACLAGGIWAMHFIGMLAFQAPVEVHYALPITLASLMIALLASWLVMLTLSQAQQTLWCYVKASVCIGLGIAAMHYVGMGAMRSEAAAYFEPTLFTLSVLIAMLAGLAALLIARQLRGGMGLPHQLKKYTASLVLGAGLFSMHFTGMAAFNLVLPAGSVLTPPGENDHLQLGLTLAVMTLLIIGSSISAALADKKLQHKEHDLQRVNALLSQLDQARMSLQQVAHYDALTSLVNRRGFNQLFAEKLSEKTKEGGMLAVVFLDIDHFKRINDSLGHDAGDELLKVLASHIKSSVRSHEDVVARFGGDEFCILIGLQDREEARQMAQRIMMKMKEPIELAGRRMVMTTSIGISLFPEDGSTCEELLKNADLALYQSKGNGRNGLNFFSANLKTRATLELQLEEELRHALRENIGLMLYYQPIFDLKTGLVSKLEALVRWQHPVHGLVPPSEFIPLAEESGLILPLGHWVMETALRQQARWRQDPQFARLSLAINVSARQFLQDDFVAQVLALVRQTGANPAQIKLELTESLLLDNVDSVIATMRALKAHGLGFSLDDFGTGYSSLSYLKRLPLDQIKIDQGFVRDVLLDASDAAIARSIIALAGSLGLSVIAEGVETTAHHQFLLAHGCQAFQGYLFGRPLTLEDFESRVRQGV